MLRFRTTVNVDNPSSVALLEHNDTFLIKSVKVDNYSGHWMRVDPDRVYVPPFTIGFLIDMFVQAQRIAVYSDRPPGIGIQSGATELDGVAIISVYDTAVFPFPGTNVAQPFIQRINIPAQQGAGDILPALPADFTPIAMAYSFPLHWAAADNNESNEHIQARQMIYYFSEEQACAAGVPTNFAFHPADNAQRLMLLSIVTATSGELIVDYTSGANDPMWRGFLMAGTPVVLPMIPNGMFLNGSVANEFQVTHDVGGTVYLNAGFARS